MALADKHAETDNEAGMRRQQAAEWYVRLSDGSTTDVQISQWLAWTRADVRNLKAFESISALASGLHALDSKTRASIVHEVIAGPPAVYMRRNPMHRWSMAYIGLAAAVVIAIVASLYLFLAPSSPAPDGIYVTERGAAIRNLVLADGTRVALGPSSVLDVEYTPGRRQVVLRTGEAYFQVKHNVRRPFGVRVGRFQVSDVGTAFDVQKVNSFVSVAVARGAVDLSVIIPLVGVQSQKLDLRPLQLVRGQGVRAQDNTDIMPVVESVDIAGMASWRRGLLQFNDVPLSVVFASVNRYSPQEIVVTDPEIERAHYTGTVYTDRINDWLEAVEHTFDLQVKRVDENGKIELVVKPNARRNISSANN